MFSNGDRYNGNYEDGKPSGLGVYIWKSGSIYEGEFKEGLKHGKGVWRKHKDDINSNRYEGEYLFDKKHGFG